MKNLLFAILAGLMFSTSAMALDECFGGSWAAAPDSDGNTDGRGIDIQMLPNDRMSGFFYTWYQNDIGIDRELFLMVGDNTDELDVTLTGYQSLYGATPSVGTVRLQVIDDNHITFSHNWKYDHRNTTNSMRWCFSDCTAEYEYTRITQPIPCE